MRYKIPSEHVNIIKKGVPSFEEIGKYTRDQKYFIINKSSFNEVKQFKYALDRIIKVNFSGQDFYSWIEQYSEVPFKLYSLLHNDRITRSSLDKKYEAPFDIDFKTQLSKKLHKKSYPKDKGKPTTIEYFESKDLVVDSNGDPILNSMGQPQYEYSNIIARIDFNFLYDDFGFILKKEAILKWYREDDSLSNEYKDIGRVFDPESDHELRVKESKIRRESIINSLRLPVLSFLKEIYPSKTSLELLTMGRNFLNKFNNETRDYIEQGLTVSDTSSPDYGKTVLWVSVRDHSDIEDDEWLDTDVGGGVTVRQYILDEINI